MSRTQCLIREQIYCCECEQEVEARLTSGREIYPHRKDLFRLPFWRCDACGNYVGCHHKTKNRTAPLGVIPTRGIMDMRKRIHAAMDPLWKSEKMARGDIYARLSTALGYGYHTANIRSVDEAEKVLQLVLELRKECEEAG